MKHIILGVAVVFCLFSTLGIGAGYASENNLNNLRSGVGDERSAVTDAFSLMDTPSAEMERQVETQALGCASGQDLQAIVDQAFDTGQPPVAGISSSVYKPGCATFAYARGQRDVAAGKAMTTATKIPFGSLTKSFTGALILRILEQLNQFGSPEAILNSPVSQYFSQDELRKLSSNCGNSFMIRAVDRATGATAPTVGRCPDWSKVKIRDLIHANSGNISLEEQDINQPPNDVLDYDDYVLRSIVVDLGIPTFSPITEPTNAFGVLDRYNIYRHPTATIGGNSPTDFPGSFGNTDYTLLGMLLERATGKSYTALAKQFITDRLGIDSMILLPTVPSAQVENAQQISRLYMDFTGADPIDPNGIYPVVTLREGRTGVDLYNLDSWSMGNSAGGAGALAGNMKSYATFFGKFVGGGLLSAPMQKVFNEGLTDTGTGTKYGFGVFLGPTEEFGSVYAKSGSLYGMECLVLSIKDSKATSITCVNQRDPFQGQSAFLVGDTAVKLLRAAQ